MMARCIALAKRAAAQGELPIASIAFWREWNALVWAAIKKCRIFVTSTSASVSSSEIVDEARQVSRASAESSILKNI
jgi:hypothetical protein